MSKFTTSIILLIALFAMTVAAQTPTTLSPTPTTTQAQATTSNGGATTPAATRPAAGNYTGISPEQISSLRNVVSSFEVGRSQSPGNSPTSKATSNAPESSLHQNSVLLGLGLVLTTIAMAAFGTVAF
ncbi:hypothetical protein BGZ83_004086 [Gryganskiella cystojenkinii]|nr:hypothetical protein BGZ83_004086 [Gryganskiella cystojenkinii]